MKPGNRHNLLYGLALVAIQHGDEACLDVLAAVNAHVNDPPLSHAEVARIFIAVGGGHQPQEKPMSNLCVDCEHYQALGRRCGHPRNQSPVDGVLTARSADEMRAADGPCGPEGRLFAGRRPAVPDMPSSGN